MKVAALCGKVICSLDKVASHLRREWQKQLLKRCGDHVYIGNNSIFTFQNISIGNDVYIGANCVFQSTHGQIVIGDHIMFGPGVHIHGGNHKIYECGKYMKHASVKGPDDDGFVTIRDDCWIGANAILLKGVTIGPGSVIGAGSVVTKDVPPYSIYTGVSDVKIRPRFSEAEMAKHLEMLGRAEGSLE